IRVKPDNPGGMQVAGSEEDILSGGAESKDGKLAPPPEAPAPQALRAPPPQVTPAPVAAPPVPAAVAAAPKPVVVAKPVPALAPAAEKHAATPASGNTLVQLTAVHSEDAANSEWQRLSKRLPDLLAQRKPAFSKTEHDGRTLWRVRTGGFSDVSQAT